MGYLSNSVHFTKFTKDGFQRNTFDAIYERLMNNMTQIREEQKSSMVQRLVEEALLLYGNMSYVDALRKLQEAMRIAQPGQIAAFTTTCTVTQVETHVSVTTSAHMVATTVRSAATREAEGPTIPLPLFAVFLTLAAALSVIWVKRANRKPNVAVTDQMLLD